MRNRHFSVLLLTWLLGGCAGFDRLTQVIAPDAGPTSAQQAAATATELAANGLWGDALDTLELAARKFPEDPQISALQASLQQKWQRVERTLEDRILVSDAENEQHKVQLLDEWLRADPDRLLLVSRRLYWKEVLAAKAEALLACSEYHLAAEPALAGRCHRMASAMSLAAPQEQRLTEVGHRLRADEQELDAQRLAEQKRQRLQRSERLLERAKEAIAGHDYRGALDILQQAAELQPDNRELSGMRAEAQAMLSPQVEALIKLGDHLYLDGQLEAAMATWQAALGLRPDDEHILARVERAKTVLQRLETLRQQQRAVPSGATAPTPPGDGAIASPAVSDGPVQPAP